MLDRLSIAGFGKIHCIEIDSFFFFFTRNGSKPLPPDLSAVLQSANFRLLNNSQHFSDFFCHLLKTHLYLLM